MENSILVLKPKTNIQHVVDSLKIHPEFSEVDVINTTEENHQNFHAKLNKQSILVKYQDDVEMNGFTPDYWAYHNINGIVGISNR
jgi:hypothetical protein